MSARNPYTATAVCRALAADVHPDSGWLRWSLSGDILEPREAWVAGSGIWVRASGRYVSGWAGDVHFGRHFRLVGAWRIRLAVRRWARRRG